MDWWAFPANLFVGLNPMKTWLIATVIAVLVTPGMMYLIGFFFEARLLPLGKNQFWGFMPGDAFLGIGVGGLVGLSTLLRPQDEIWLNAWWIRVPVTAGLIIVTYVLRIGEQNGYPLDVLGSPTKLYHDFFLFGVYLWFIVSIALSVIGGVIMGSVPLGLFLLALVPVVVWAGLVFFVDAQRGYSKMARYAHVVNSVTLWQNGWQIKHYEPWPIDKIGR